MATFKSIEEIAALLHMTAGTVREKRRAGEFPGAVKVGRRWLVPTEDVEAYLETQRSK